jgi:prophage regulatory protein
MTAMQRLLDKRALAELVPYHPEHCMRLARRGLFPKPIKLGDGISSRVAWRESDIEAWLEERAQRDLLRVKHGDAA